MRKVRTSGINNAHAQGRFSPAGTAIAQIATHSIGKTVTGMPTASVINILVSVPVFGKPLVGGDGVSLSLALITLNSVT